MGTKEHINHCTERAMTTSEHVISQTPNTEVVVAHDNNQGSAVARGLDLALQNGMERQKYLVPPNDLSDLVHFIFNNLPPLSLPSMASEFHEAVSHVYLPWMAQYLVKRAGIEPNLHSLYMAFIDYLEDMPLFELVLQETYSQIREIFLADQPFTGSSSAPSACLF